MRGRRPGVNTIRTYYTPTLDYLDKCAEHNIRVAVGIPYYDDRTHPGPDIKSGSYLGYVAAIKDHPAVAFILLGNEYNYHPEWFEGDINNWYSSQAKAVDLIKMVDSKHPVGTVHGGVTQKELLEGFYKNVDIIAINDYAFRASDIGYDVRWLHDNTPPETSDHDCRNKTGIPTTQLQEKSMSMHRQRGYVIYWMLLGLITNIARIYLYFPIRTRTGSRKWARVRRLLQ